ncbi:acyl-CoA dehydrogenase [Rhodococcus sp. (in: high G+C Gram-positive bacteria)]|uniref:acyl-CoA dehydrogenase n=1 Tax=Rhodococcus sp. TaxID=1831 RepID=UPI00257AC0FC|nr:acyl-CoA dehydrogenase [Rhodococcus sp. (in: high G+C Gram-positive bacteria)]MBQ7805958.1 acyl-CoA dehydrogenase [Rhodococcus sp. (in: high G+C Gram-positive bacteria)]
MSHYRSNLRDIKFDLFDLLDRGSVYGSGLFDEFGVDAAHTVLDEAERYATNKLASTFADGDREPVTFDAADNSVRLPSAYRQSAADYLNSGWLDLELPQAMSEQAIPPSLKWCVTEMMLGANAAIPQGLNVIPQVVRLLHDHGNARQRRLAELIVEHKWMVTMILTEPDAGSDVGAGRTRAVPQEDGTWHLEGVKRFITYGDHDLTENIIHLVLARPTGVEGAGGPGTAGLSLFVVPKYHFDDETGVLGRRNGVRATGLEHKMGITGSPTCEMTFGAEDPAVGWLLADQHAGIKQMFEIIKHVRMLVGVKAMAALSTGYLNARDYALERVQGQALGAPHSSASVPIIDHPDVRRSLMTQKSYAEGMRALILYTASQQDRIDASRAQGVFDAEADACHQLMLPVIKGFCSETAWRILGQESLQTFGGSGFLRDYPLEQYLRDTKVDTLYEGTTGIQGLDLLSRKIVRDNGAALERLFSEMSKTSDGAVTDAFGAEREALRSAITAVRSMSSLLVERWGDSADKSQRPVAAQDTTGLLLALGTLTCGWLLLRSADVASALLKNAPAKDRDFLCGKVATGQWYARHILSTLRAELSAMKLSDSHLNELPREAF